MYNPRNKISTSLCQINIGNATLQRGKNNCAKQ
jgi:hypothetical protein